MSEKLFQKYKIEKTDGTPVDPEAQYFVLRLDTDPYAREAMWEYIEGMNRKGEHDFAGQLMNWLCEVIEKVHGNKDSGEVK